MTASNRYNLQKHLKRELAENVQDYNDQQDALTQISTWIERKQALSMDSVLALHKIFKTHAQDNSPGQFRTICVGSNAKQEPLSEQGIVEIIKKIQSEAEQKFPEYNGTWLGPLEEDSVSFEESIHHGNIKEKQKELSDEQFAKQIFADTKKRKYAILFARTNSTNRSIPEYMQFALQNYINQFNADIQQPRIDKMQVICAFIKNCIRLHPFRDCNHRVFAFGVLNFLLASHGIGFCALENRRQFSCIGLAETVNAVKTSTVKLTLMSNEEKHQQLKKPIKKHLPIYPFDLETILKNYKTKSFVGFFCTANPIRSQSIRQLSELQSRKAKMRDHNRSAISYEEIEDVFKQDSAKRLRLFHHGHPKERTNTSTDDVIMELRDLFSKNSYLDKDDSESYSI